MKMVILFGVDFLNFGNKYKVLFEILLLNLVFVLGIVGFLYILIWFYIVKDVKMVCIFVVLVIWIIGVFYIMMVFFGFGVVVFVGFDVIMVVD